MQRHWKSRILFVAVTILSATMACAATQNPSTDYQEERNQAIDLFNQNKHLDALPLFEDLARQKPKDDKVLVALATCLVSHAATLEDEDAAVKERVRAREILLKAKDLGNNGNLLQNLLQMLPPDGRLRDSKTPADEAMRRGEAAFARNDFDEAIRNYSTALELDPKNYPAALFIGDSYFGAKDWAKAAEWYERAIQINPNVETGYRYYADMLTKNGDMEKARTLAIQAVVADPYNSVTWRGLDQWARSNHVTLTDVHMNVPRDSVSATDEKHINITIDPNKPSDTEAVWLAYSMRRATWQTEEFKKHFPQEEQYRHSLAEETEALTLAAQVCTELIKTDSDKGKKSSLRKDPDLVFLLKLYQANAIEPYLLLTAPDEGIAQDYAAYREKNRAKLESYLSDFVVPQVSKTK